MHREIEHENPRAVGIDLQHNGGGNSALLLPLLRGLPWKAALPSAMDAILATK